MTRIAVPGTTVCVHSPMCRVKDPRLLAYPTRYTRNIGCGRLTYHSHYTGELKVDDSEDFWADHDEDCHGEIDTDEMREEFPEGFKWDCCNEKGDSDEYCEIGRHVAKADASASLKRAKV